MRRGIARTTAVGIIVIILLAAVAGVYYFAGTTSPESSSSSTSHSSTSSSVSTSTLPPIVVGIETPQEGPFAVLSKSLVAGATLAVSQVNANGGVLGHQFQLKVVDEGTGFDSAQAVTAAQILTRQQNVSFMLGPFTSGDLAATLPVTTQQKVIQLLSVASTDALMVPPQNKYLFMVTVPNSGFATTSDAWLKIVGAKNFMFEAEDFLFTHDISNVTQKLTSARGVNMLSTDFYPASATDYSAAINKITANNPGAVILIMDGPNGVSFVKQYAANPVTAKIPLLNLITLLVSPSVVTDIDNSVPNGAQYLFLSPGFELSKSSDVGSYVQSLSSTYNESPSTYSASAYVSILLLAQALQKAGSLDVDAVATALAASDYSSIAGRIVFRSNHIVTVGPGYTTAAIQQIVLSANTIHYQNIWPPEIANATAINPGTGNPYS